VILLADENIHRLILQRLVTDGHDYLMFSQKGRDRRHVHPSAYQGLAHGSAHELSHQHRILGKRRYQIQQAPVGVMNWHQILWRECSTRHQGVKPVLGRESS
jgi:hypothetical protein